MNSQMNELKVEQYGSARVIDNELEKYRYNIYSISFLAILGVLIWGVEQELFIKYGKDNETTDRVILLSVNLFITFLVIVLTIMSYFQEVFIRKAEGVLLTIDTLDRERIIYLIFEIVLNLIHPMPFLANATFQEKIYVLDISLPKRYDWVLYLAMLHIRFYHFLRPFLLSSDFMTNRAFRVCKISRTDCNYWFAIRSTFKKYTMSVTCWLFVFWTAFYGALMRFNEGSAHELNDEVQNFNWDNSFWCAYITMTTVGYGDFYPVTVFGRIVGVLWSLVGSLIQSLAVIALFEVLEFSPGEVLAYKLLHFLRK